MTQTRLNGMAQAFRTLQKTGKNMDLTIADAIMDRLAFYSHLIEITGDTPYVPCLPRR